MNQEHPKAYWGWLFILAKYQFSLGHNYIEKECRYQNSHSGIARFIVNSYGSLLTAASLVSSS